MSLVSVVTDWSLCREYSVLTKAENNPGKREQNERQLYFLPSYRKKERKPELCSKHASVINIV